MVKKQSQPAKQNRVPVQKKLFLEAMGKTFGNITKSCELVGIDRSTPYKWAEKDKKFAEKFKSDHWSEMYLDTIESKLSELAFEERNPTALIFLAKTKAKHRGYVERQEVQNEISGHLTHEDVKRQLKELVNDDE